MIRKDGLVNEKENAMRNNLNTLSDISAKNKKNKNIVEIWTLSKENLSHKVLAGPENCFWLWHKYEKDFDF